MRKLFITIIMASASFFASAQYMMVSTINIPEENESWGTSNFTDNIGIGYQLNDKMVVGAVKNGEDYDLFGRYDMKEVYLSMQMPMDSTASDNMVIGVGYSFDLGKNIYLEPNYTMPLNADDNGDREGKFNLGVAYKF